MPVVPPQCPVQCSVEGEYCVVARRNDSLGACGRRLAFGLAAGVSLVLGTAFVAAGAWPVLPWSLVEIAALAGALAYVERRAHDWERLTVNGDRLIVERMSAGRLWRREWNRHWVRVTAGPRTGRRGPVLLLQAGGEACEFGGLLADDARHEVKRALTRLTAR